MALPVPSDRARVALAPTGTLRAAINLSNFLLVTDARNPDKPRGVSPEMAKLLADQLEVDLQMIGYRSPSEIADSAAQDNWDVGNIGNEPARAQHMAFSPPYAEIDATYLVPPGSSVSTIAEIDQEGTTIASAQGAAYTLWLEDNLKSADLVYGRGLNASFDVFVEKCTDALAGLRVKLLDDAEKLPGSRVLDGRFTAVQQSMGIPRSRDEAGVEYLSRFVTAAITDGHVAALIKRFRVGAGLTPPAP